MEDTECECVPSHNFRELVKVCVEGHRHLRESVELLLASFGLDCEAHSLERVGWFVREVLLQFAQQVEQEGQLSRRLQQVIYVNTSSTSQIILQVFDEHKCDSLRIGLALVGVQKQEGDHVRDVLQVLEAYPL